TGREGPRHAGRCGALRPRPARAGGRVVPRGRDERPRFRVGRSVLLRDLLQLRRSAVRERERVTLGPSRPASITAESTMSTALPCGARHEHTLRATPPAWAVGARGAPSTLAGSAFWLVCSNLLFAGCQWGTIVAFAKLG